MAIEFAERIRRIPVYPVASGYDLGTDIAMLASNESCFAPLPVVAEAAQRTLMGTNRYPDPSYSDLRSALASRYGVASERIALGQGSCDILLSAGEALLEPGAEVVYAWPAFSVYPHLAAASGARAIEVALDADDRHDLDAMAREITVATRLALEDDVRRLGVWVADSDANFIWLRLPDTLTEGDALTGLRERGVLVRAGASLGREGCLRVTVGTGPENARFAAALRDLL